MSNLKNISDADLEAEVARRAEEKKKKSMPQPQLVIDWSPLQRYIEEGVKHVNDEGYEMKDFEHYLFETAMEAVYGPDFWKWWNSKL